MKPAQSSLIYTQVVVYYKCIINYVGSMLICSDFSSCDNYNIESCPIKISKDKRFRINEMLKRERYRKTIILAAIMRGK